MEAITTPDFLKEILSIKVPNPWEAASPLRTPDAGSGNINRLSENVFSFQVHNLLPTSDDDILDGHFTFLVNYKTFEYFVYSHAYYGSLTYTTQSKDTNLYNSKNLPKISKQRVESLIAHKLLGAYFYNPDAINNNGVNLFSNGKQERDGKRIRFRDGAKISLICDNRGYIWTNLRVDEIEPKNLALVQQLDKDFKINKVGNVEVNEILVTKKSDRGWGYEASVTVMVNDEPKEVIVRRVKEFSFYSTMLFDKHKNKLIKYSFTDARSFKDVRQVIKDLFRYTYK